MDVNAITSCLRELDLRPRGERIRAVTLHARTPGGSKPWNCLASDQSWYVVKCRNNPQDERLGSPLKFLTTDLVCGRLGQLFDPPLCPKVEIIDVPLNVASLATHPPTKHRSAHKPAPGPSFGSRLVENAIEVKIGGSDILDDVELEQVARLITFQTWLRGIDVSALVTSDRRLLSIDHGFFLTVYRWDDPKFAKAEKIKPKIPSQFRMVEQLKDPSLFAVILNELMSISDSEIIRAFADIPSEWGASLELRSKAAAYVLLRRRLIPQAISALWNR
ncbi:HipA family kinase [Paenibacillus montanisoli]|uniref:HipA-like kinase domain-containing protein n=1 Tax=Paenibacillus montanisoli TaxID=2081970 RepID=A0A328U648_9BACL|nr:hypothetical protein DL346_01655 [Paenibacillus montanisoli]